MPHGRPAGQRPRRERQPAKRASGAAGAWLEELPVGAGVGGGGGGQLWAVLSPPALPEVGIDPGKIEIDPSILDRFEIDSIQIMGLERQIDLTLKWS